MVEVAGSDKVQIACRLDTLLAPTPDPRAPIQIPLPPRLQRAGYISRMATPPDLIRGSNSRVFRGDHGKIAH
jgi:hypothetical protein